MNHEKIYTISVGIGPYIKSCLLEDVTKSNSSFSIQVGETPDSEKRVNQFDVIIRYYSKNVVVHHLESLFIGHTKADNLYTSATIHERYLICLKRIY